MIKAHLIVSITFGYCTLYVGSVLSVPVVLQLHIAQLIHVWIRGESLQNNIALFTITICKQCRVVLTLSNHVLSNHVLTAATMPKLEANTLTVLD